MALMKVLSSKNADRIANSEDLDQTATLKEAVVGCALYA